jgi:dipeptidyl-peptidase-4
MTKNFALLFAAFLFVTVSAQKNLTLDEVVMSRARLSPSNLMDLQWIAGTNSYSWIRTIGLGEELCSSSGDGKNIKTLCTLVELNAKIQQAQITALGQEKFFPSVKWSDADHFYFLSQDYRVTFDLKMRSIKADRRPLFPGGAENHDESDVSKYTAFTVNNNLFVMMDGKERQVTSDLNPGIVNGKSYHREEFGIYKGTFWSPNGKSLAFARMDETMVTEYPIVEIGSIPATARMIRYPMAGQKSHQVTIGVYNTALDKTVFLKTGEPAEQYLTNIAWSPDNKWIYVAVVNRGQDHLWLNRYNAETGSFDKTLFEEADKEWVQPYYTLKFVPGHDDQFVWNSEREGYNALYLYKTDGTLLRQLTPTVQSKITPSVFPQMSMGACVVTDVYGFDAKGTTCYFQCAPANSINRQVMSVDMKKGIQSLKWLTPYDGTSTAKFSKDFSQFICDFSNLTTPHKISVVKSSGGELGTIHTAPDPLAAYNKCVAKLFTITAADGITPLWCRMYLPAGFDSTKKYPSLTYVYNGPNVQTVTNTWLAGNDLFLYYMAQQGFVVFTVDGRGSDNRGLDFEQAVHRHLGTQELADQKMGSNYLKSKSWIDGNRMAVYGWSYGGFMTTSMLTRNPDVYRCGVAGGAVIDWQYYEIMYTERYMDTPQENPEGYKEANTINYVQNLKGKLLEIHGTSDDVVVWQHTLAYTQAAISKGVQTDYYMYPGHPHGVRGKDRIHLVTKISNYVIENTK